MNGSSTSHHTNNLTYTEMQDWKYSIAYPIMNELCDALSKESREVLDSIYSKMERLGDGSFYRTMTLNNFVKVDGASCTVINAIAENEDYKLLYLKACKSLAQQRVDEAVNFSARISAKIDKFALGWEGLE